MLHEESKTPQSTSEKIFSQIEQDLESGETRDLWLSLQEELSEKGSEGVRTYLESEYQRQKSIVETALNQLDNQLGGIA